MSIPGSRRLTSFTYEGAYLRALHWPLRLVYSLGTAKQRLHTVEM